MSPSVQPLTADQRLYDARYEAGYMEGFGHLYEATRERMVRAVLSRLSSDGLIVGASLDYGCGEGRWFSPIRASFGSTSLTGADISPVALAHARRLHPDATVVQMDSERVDLPDATFDLVVSIEVLEHVGDVRAATAEIGRLLRPGGVAVISTPCANRWSLEWLINKLGHGLQPSKDGYGRFATDEPGHLRRLREAELRSLLSGSGMRTDRVYHAAHMFTTLAFAAERVRGYQRIPLRMRVAIAMLDWHLLRNLPNGATMIAVASRQP
jgi:SAM-dependent methyltransferase